MSTENNKLIAEFMGMTYGDPNDNSVMIQMTPQGNEVVPIKSMKYHCSWDWLMPVVREILITIELDSLYYDTEELRYNILDCDISGAYKEIVEFIMEYNLKNSMEETEEVSIFDIFINLTSKTNK